MMKKIITLLFFWLLGISAFSQEKTVSIGKQSYVAVSVGSSIPLQDYKSTDGNNAYAGFAKSGKKYDILWGKDLKNPHWGITGLFRFHKNPVDDGALASTAKTAYPSYDYTISAKDWKLYTLLGGAYYRIPVSKKMTIMPKAMIGLAYIYSPEINVVANNNASNVATSFTESSHTVTPSWLFSIGLKSNLFKRIVLVSNFDFLGAFPTFSDVKSSYGNGTSITRTKSPSFLTFNYGIGIGYKF
jgi:hypothetical protein